MRGLTTAQLAVRLDLGDRRVAELLLELRDAGLAEPSPNGWKLTPAAESRYGDALRSLDLPPLDTGRSTASSRQPIAGLDAEAA